jgi:heptosyltransferase III
MINVLERLPSGARVAIIRLRSLGDCVLTTPALSLLKQARPDLQIALVVEDCFAPVFSGNPDVDRILSPNAGSLSRFRPQLALNLHGGATSVRLMLAAASGLRAGFGHFRFQPMYNVRIPRAQDILDVHRTVHTAEHLASAMFYLGVPHAEIPRARLFAEPVSRPRPYAVLHPFASEPAKTWPRENFLAVAKHLNDDLGIEPVFVGGASDDLLPFGPHTCLPGAPLEEVKSLIAGAALFVGNDSGPAHIAAAFGRPVVVLFGSSDIDNWRPWRTENSTLSSAGGIHSIEVSEVTAAIETLAPLPSGQPSA